MTRRRVPRTSDRTNALEPTSSQVWRLWNHWLERNRHDFIYPPYRAANPCGEPGLRFTGLHPQLSAVLGVLGINVWVSAGANGTEHWDILRSFDVQVKRTRDYRYFCDFCTTPVYFTSLPSLWEMHVFGEFMAWCNTHFQPGHVIALSSDPDFRYGRLLRPEEVVRYGYQESLLLSVVV